MSAVPAAAARRSVAEIETFIAMLASACSDAMVNTRLERLLAMPDAKRQATVHHWVSEMLIGQAPRDFIAAIACLHDDRVAEKAYEVIFHCRRDQAWLERDGALPLINGSPAPGAHPARAHPIAGLLFCAAASCVTLAAAVACAPDLPLAWAERGALAATLVVAAVLLFSAADG